MNCQIPFSGKKIKKNIINLSSAEFIHSTVNVKHPLGAFTDFMQLLNLYRFKSCVLFYTVSHIVNICARLESFCTYIY